MESMRGRRQLTRTLVNFRDESNNSFKDNGVELTSGEGAMDKVEVTSEVYYVSILLKEDTLKTIKTRSFERFYELKVKITSSSLTNLVREGGQLDQNGDVWS
ncbi:hypothetical protein MTR_1g083280 [Medicago truncatula]|uniref:Uncharacterized protein n=1 Tax=Medicago truncatula TaxID=3880 RepID=G7I8P2_MEDTR|nr:hypothetical protein MTR_1g083280 [Medicago truncatula]